MRVYARHRLANTMHNIVCFMTGLMLPTVNIESRGIISQHFNQVIDPSRADYMPAGSLPISKG